jgi:hypothetical protein
VQEIEQPPDISFALTDGIFIKQLFIKSAGSLVPQHSHEYSHVSMLAVGAIRAWCDGVLLGDFVAPHPLHIAALKKHTFQSLVDNTLIYCIHNVSRTGEVDIHEEHQIGEGSCPGVPL